jgi:hypothetical protein
MRRARPDELNEDAKPIALLQLSEDRLRELFPVEFSEVDPLAAAEPSIGSLVQFDSGFYAVVMYGNVLAKLKSRFPSALRLLRIGQHSYANCRCSRTKLCGPPKPSRRIIAPEEKLAA